MTATACGWCSKPFAGPTATRSDKIYCGSTCRKAAWRSDRVSRAREIKAALSTVALASMNPTAARSAVAAGALDERAAEVQAVMNGQPSWTPRLNRVKTVWPDAVGWFGEPALIAAATGAPSGQCRFCLAWLESRVHGGPAPKIDPGTTELLGPACGKCRERQAVLLASLPAKVHPTRAFEIMHARSWCGICDAAWLTRDKDPGTLSPTHRTVLTASAKAHEPIRSHDAQTPVRCKCAHCERARRSAAARRR